MVGWLNGWTTPPASFLLPYLKLSLVGMVHFPVSNISFSLVTVYETDLWCKLVPQWRALPLPYWSACLQADLALKK